MARSAAFALLLIVAGEWEQHLGAALTRRRAAPVQGGRARQHSVQRRSTRGPPANTLNARSLPPAASTADARFLLGEALVGKGAAALNAATAAVGGAKAALGKGGSGLGPSAVYTAPQATYVAPQATYVAPQAVATQAVVSQPVVQQVRPRCSPRLFPANNLPTR